jgi:hypothetical protein
MDAARRFTLAAAVKARHEAYKIAARVPGRTICVSVDSTLANLLVAERASRTADEEGVSSPGLVL